MEVYYLWLDYRFFGCGLLESKKEVVRYSKLGLSCEDE